MYAFGETSNFLCKSSQVDSILKKIRRVLTVQGQIMSAVGQVYFFNKKISGALVHQRTIPTERPPLVGEVSANFSG
jgi:hypothetical protein